MDHSPPSLHAPVLKTAEQQELLSAKMSSLVQERLLAEKALPPMLPLPAATSLDIPLSTVSLQGNFDAHIHIHYPGTANETLVCLMVDSGNSCMIVPDYDAIKNLPGYTVLETGVHEPWGCPAVILRGPIDLPKRGGGFYTIPNCVFYACIGKNTDNKTTANFGVGCVYPWIVASQTMTEIKSPLAYDATYPFAEFNYAPAGKMLTTASDPVFDGGSSLTLYKARPAGYQTFDILKGVSWMSLAPLALSIGGALTAWPGNLASPIAMVDTGGGPVFLSDPNADVYTTVWPDAVPLPNWIPGSTSCQAIQHDLEIKLGDQHGLFSYRIDTTNLPAPVKGLTLVMCETCSFMMGQNGMNIGGLSALFNYILIDYGSAKVGFKAKPPELAVGPAAVAATV